jgi:hypothetical protein
MEIKVIHVCVIGRGFRGLHVNFLAPLPPIKSAPARPSFHTSTEPTTFRYFCSLRQHQPSALRIALPSTPQTQQQVTTTSVPSRHGYHHHYNCGNEETSAPRRGHSLPLLQQHKPSPPTRQAPAPAGRLRDVCEHRAQTPPDA